MPKFVPEKHKDQLAIFIKDLWFTPLGLLSSLFATVCVGLYFLPELGEYKFPLTETQLPLRATLICAGLVLNFLVWNATNKYKKPHKGKVGIGVCLVHEETKDTQQLHDDFISALQKSLYTNDKKINLELIPYPRRHAIEVTDAGTAASFAKKNRLSFLLFGKIKLRKIDGTNRHIIDLQGLISHQPLNDEAQKSLESEFNQSLPTRFILDAEENLLGCEISAKISQTAAKYVIGIAALYSGFYEYALNILNDVERTIPKEAENVPQLEYIKHKTKAHLSELYRAKYQDLMIKYNQTYDSDYLKEAEPIQEKIREYNADNYSTYLGAAICAFISSRDVKEAKRCIEKGKNKKDATWLFSLAFLSAYEGNLDDAYKKYERAQSIPLNDPTVPIQCEMFIQDILEQEPEKVGLYFCLGILNFKFKNDFLSAKMDFEEFIEQTKPEDFPNQHKAVNTWLKEIDKSISTNNQSPDTEMSSRQQV